MGEDEILCGCGYMYEKGYGQEIGKCPACDCWEGEICEH